MRVFSVEMLVKEEGAATVQAALNRLKKETQAVAAEMKATTAQVTATGRAMQTTGTGTQIAGDRAAKAAIGFAAVGQSMARTGSLTADAGTRIVEAGSQIAMMFGPKGLAIAAILSFTAMVATKFNETAANAKKMAEEFDKELRGLTRSGNIDGLTQKIRDLTFGTGEGVVEFDKYGREVIDINDGLRRMEERVRQLQARSSQGVPALVRRLDREELERLNAEIRTATTEIQQLQRAVMSSRVGTARSVTTPVTISAAAPPSTANREQQRALEEANRAGERLLASGFMASLEQAGFESGRASAIIDQMVEEYSAEVAKKAPDAAAKIAEAAKPIGEKLNVELATSIGSAVEGGILSGLEMAIASGNIGDGFKAMGQAIIRSMASAMVNVALKAIGFASKMKAITSFMASHPILALGAAVALLAMARAAGGTASGAEMGAIGGPGGLSYAPVGASAPSQQIIFGATSATTAAGMTPRSATNVTIIGPNDPSAQRAMQELLAKANSRGKVG